MSSATDADKYVEVQLYSHGSVFKTVHVYPQKNGAWLYKDTTGATGFLEFQQCVQTILQDAIKATSMSINLPNTPYPNFVMNRTEFQECETRLKFIMRFLAVL